VSGRRGTPPRIHDVEIGRFLQALSAMPIEITPSESITACRSVLELTVKHTISAYDAAYLDLALRRDLPIGKLNDTRKRQGLRQATEAANVTLFRAR